ncbi:MULTISPECIES: LysE family translocator [unclassified Bradyrhizobium]|uniref:LysE family translocator n=1 Tax=unclassified Bradyrhizobium TaxID=2631580 RepID=UPI002916CE4F|nr:MULTISPECIES: LysE family translocator [unclassified Bradyrhizobium]
MNGANFALFFAAALVIAAVPGPGILYVAAKTLADGRVVGMTATFGTALGGMIHVIAGGIGVSALLLASAQLFTAVKFAGALYLIWIGLQSFRSASSPKERPESKPDARRAFRDGIFVEALNPKTAAFFLAFIPQFIDLSSTHPGAQFVLLGSISVMLNTLADVIVVAMASTVRSNLTQRPSLLRRLHQGSGLFMMGLGVSLTLARRPAAS